MMNKRLAILGTFVLIASMLLTACGPTGTPVVQVQTSVVEVKETVIVAGTSVEKIVTQVVEKVITATPVPVEKKKVLRINLGTYPDIVDPQKSSFVNEIAHLNMMYEGLTRFNDKLETVPGAAEKWEYTPDAMQLTFTLREGLKYSDGTLLNAMRYQYSIMRNINPATAGEYAAITDEIKGAPEWRTGADAAGTAVCQTDEEKAACEAVVAESVAALDMSGNACTDYEQADCRVLKLTFSKPAPYFHTIMGIWVSYPAKQELIEEGGEIWWLSSKFQIGNGPFVLQSMEPYVRGYFTPNPNYWGGVANVDIEYRYIVDSAVSFQAYKNNEFDIVGLAAEDLETVQADPVLSKEANIYPGSCTYALMFHQQKEPFTDQKVREAFSMAIDRETWVSDVLKGLGKPTLTWIPPGYPGFKEGETRWGYNPEAAKQAIAESSYGSVDKLPKVTATFSDSPRNRLRYEWLASKIGEVLGITIELNPVEATTYTALTKDITTAPQMYILGWCADYPDPQNWLSVYWKTGGFGQRIAYSNPDFDALVNEADTSTDPAKRSDLYAQAQDLLTAGAPVAFFWNNVNTYLIKPWVKGIVLTPQDAGWAGNVSPLTIDIDTTMLP
jgi:oligopeptide transport system substrate-binding protein